jgi:hypothetical protein
VFTFVLVARLGHGVAVWAHDVVVVHADHVAGPLLAGPCHDGLATRSELGWRLVLVPQQILQFGLQVLRTGSAHALRCLHFRSLMLLKVKHFKFPDLECSKQLALHLGSKLVQIN